MRLFRPIGLKELELIIGSQNKSYPPRLDWQPIFYPVLNFEYAAQIAKRWNTEDEFSGHVGFVTEFELADDFIAKYEVQNVGGKIHNEYWIPSEKLSDMNQAIVGRIQITGSYYGSGYKGIVSETALFKNMSVEEQAVAITNSPQGIIDAIKTERAIILANMSYWELNTLIPEEIIAEIKSAWNRQIAEISLNRLETIKGI